MASLQAEKSLTSLTYNPSGAKVKPGWHLQINDSDICQSNDGDVKFFLHDFAPSRLEKLTLDEAWIPRSFLVNSGLIKSAQNSLRQLTIRGIAVPSWNTIYLDKMLGIVVRALPKLEDLELSFGQVCFEGYKSDGKSLVLVKPAEEVATVVEQSCLRRAVLRGLFDENLPGMYKLHLPALEHLELVSEVNLRLNADPTVFRTVCPRLVHLHLELFDLVDELMLLGTISKDAKIKTNTEPNAATETDTIKIVLRRVSGNIANLLDGYASRLKELDMLASLGFAKEGLGPLLAHLAERSLPKLEVLKIRRRVNGIKAAPEPIPINADFALSALLMNTERCPKLYTVTLPTSTTHARSETGMTKAALAKKPVDSLGRARSVHHQFAR